jgi:hypothetical protein
VVRVAFDNNPKDNDRFDAWVAPHQLANREWDLKTSGQPPANGTPANGLLPMVHPPANGLLPMVHPRKQSPSCQWYPLPMVHPPANGPLPMVHPRKQSPP